jgi:hypothetical protein
MLYSFAKFYKSLFFITMILLLFMALPKVFADVTYAENVDHYYALKRGDVEIKIDANFDDWATVENILVMGEKTWEPLGGTWDGPADLTANLQIIYDADNLYFALQVQDDEYVAEGGGFWENDGPQMAIDTSAGKIPAGWPNKTTHLYNFSIKDGWNKETGPYLGDAEIVMKRDEAKKMNLFEWRMPVGIIAAPGTKLTQGMEIAFAIIINDSDLNAKGQTGWVGWGNHTIVFGKNPEEMRTIVLGEDTIGTASAVNSTGKLTSTWGSLKK